MASQEAKVTSFYCQACSKKISNEAAYQNHIVSAKHKQQVARLEQHHQDKGSTSEEADSNSIARATQQDSNKSEGAMDTGMQKFQPVGLQFLYQANVYTRVSTHTCLHTFTHTRRSITVTVVSLCFCHLQYFTLQLDEFYPLCSNRTLSPRV